MWRWAENAGPTSTGMGPILKLPNKVSFLTLIGLVLFPVNTRLLLLHNVNSVREGPLMMS